MSENKIEITRTRVEAGLAKRYRKEAAFRDAEARERLAEAGRAAASTGQPRFSGQIFKARCIVAPPVERVSLALKMRQEDLRPSIAIEVIGDDSHSGLGIAAEVVSNTPPERGFLEASAAVVEP